VLTTSAVAGEGIAELWASVRAHQDHTERDGRRLARRREQAVAWLRELVTTGLGRALAGDPEVAGVLSSYENRVREFKISAVSASNELLRRFLRRG
jgi:LAO/AO transport system kinase